MTRNEDELDGWDALSPRQRAAVTRYTARSGRHQRDRIEPTNRDRWDAFYIAEAQNEAERDKRN
jgi:predicted Fe-S protein YdhL (DUF1289 family)